MDDSAQGLGAAHSAGAAMGGSCHIRAGVLGQDRAGAGLLKTSRCSARAGEKLEQSGAWVQGEQG